MADFRPFSSRPCQAHQSRSSEPPPCHSASDKDKVRITTPSGCRASRVLLRVQCVLASPGRRSLAAVSVSGCCVLFPARYVAGAVVACVRLSSSVPSSSPVVAAVRLALARSQRLVALGGQSAEQLRKTEGPDEPNQNPGQRRTFMFLRSNTGRAAPQSAPIRQTKQQSTNERSVMKIKASNGGSDPERRWHDTVRSKFNASRKQYGRSIVLRQGPPHRGY